MSPPGRQRRPLCDVRWPRPKSCSLAECAVVERFCLSAEIANVLDTRQTERMDAERVGGGSLMVVEC